MFERLKRLYDTHRLDDAGVARAVVQGWITQEQADQISGIAEAASETPEARK